MKFAVCLGVLSLAATTLAVPASNIPRDVAASAPRQQSWMSDPYFNSNDPSKSDQGGKTSSLPDPNKGPKFKPDNYGDFFKYPKVPYVPPKSPWTKPPTAGHSTCEDANNNPWLPNSPEHRGHWSYGFNINTDMQRSWPTTFRTVRHTWTISNMTLAPEGVPKQMLVVNGQYPGPPLIANWGDFIEITIINGLKYNGTGIHWHGFRQLYNNLADGAAGATECPIPPGESRTYRFQATQFGSSWYHSHFSVQYGDGAVGPIIINGPSSANYDIDLGTVLVNEWYSMTAPQADALAQKSGPPQASNYMINGQNIALTGKTGKRAQFKFTPGKKHLLRFVNVAMDGQFKMSIDGHKLKVVQADFVPIVPYHTNEVAMHIGQRYHVIVEADQTPGNYFLRAMASTDCTRIANKGNDTANAIVSYENAPYPGMLPNSTATNHTNTCVDEPIASLVPVVKSTVDSSSFLAAVKTEAVDLTASPAKRSDIEIAPGVKALGRRQGGPPSGGQGGPPPGGAGGPPPGGAGGPPPGGAGGPPVVFHWTLGGISMVLDWNKPTVAQVAMGNTTYPRSRNVVSLDQRDVWTYWVVQNKFFVPHPMHLHGHDFHLLGQGTGTFDPSTDMSKLNFEHPTRRDVALLVALGWIVIAFKTDNPGAWLMHCHIAFHAGGGLSLQFIERPQDIPKLYKSQVEGSEYQNACKKFEKYQNATAPWPQYDSGLRRRDPVFGEVFDNTMLYPRRSRDVVRKTL